MNKTLFNSKRLLSFLLLLITLCVLLSSCSGSLALFVLLSTSGFNPTGDWIYHVSDDYAILRLNGRTIQLGKQNPNYKVEVYSTVVENYITCFCYNENFVAVRRLNVPGNIMKDEIFEMDFEQAAYYLVDMTTDEIYGPFESADDFNTACADLNVTDLCDWINTHPAPEGAG